MSKDDYARIFIHAPTRLVLALALAFGGGAGWYHLSGHDPRIESAQRDLDSCLVALADSRSIAHQHARSIAELSDWASETLRTLGEFRRLEALRSAPAAYSSARGMEISR